MLAFWALPAGAAFAQEPAAPEQGPPPTELTERNGFWTANNAPPDTENFEVHIVQMGDTLWALAGQYLQNPLLWPQLWETNEHIVNPHWIYPEDPILIRPITRITEVEPPEPEPAPEPEPVDEVVEAPRPVQLPTLTRDLPPPTPGLTFDLPDAPSAPEVKIRDLYCSGFVTTRSLSHDLRILAKAPGTSTEGLFSAEGEYIYLSRGTRDGVGTGDVFTVIRPTREVSSVRNNVGDLGLHYLELGQVQVITAQADFSMARVVHTCDAVSAGDQLVPFVEIDFPELPRNRPFSPTMPPTGGTTGAIAITQSVLSMIHEEIGTAGSLAGIRSGRFGTLSGGLGGEGEIVYIDLGEGDGIATGDLFLIYRPLNLDNRFVNVDRETRERLADAREVIGELVVLKVGERAATALITYSADGVVPGDRIERR
jgi:hypothetical protein